MEFESDPNDVVRLTASCLPLCQPPASSSSAASSYLLQLCLQLAAVL
jgi:hypothetical protein